MLTAEFIELKRCDSHSRFSLSSSPSPSLILLVTQFSCNKTHKTKAKFKDKLY